MSYSTIMVHMDLASPNDAVLHVVSSLADRFAANVIGIAASQPMSILYDEGYVPADVIQADLVDLAKANAEAEALFRSALHRHGAGLAWRSATATMPLADYVVREARAADLIVTGPDIGFSTGNASRSVVVSDLVLHAGRPVLIVPPNGDEPDLGNVAVAWKDTREARRAVADALPLLKLAGRVSLVEIADADEVAAARARLADVANWLRQHGITADVFARTSDGNTATQLRDFALDQGAGVMVTGAYGHGRLREWVFGGVTRDLLAHPALHSLLSH